MKHVNVGTLLVRQGDTNWSPTCPKKSLPGFALEAEAMAYSGGECQCSRQRRRASLAERRREEQNSLNLQRYNSCVGQRKVAALDQPVSLDLHACCVLRSFSRYGLNVWSYKNETRAGLWVGLCCCVDHLWSVGRWLDGQVYLVLVLFSSETGSWLLLSPGWSGTHGCPLAASLRNAGMWACAIIPARNWLFFYPSNVLSFKIWYQMNVLNIFKIMVF